MSRRKWTKYELHTLLCFMAKQEHTESRIHLATELNKSFSLMDYASDIDMSEIHTKVVSLLKERPAFAKMLLRNRTPKLTRTLRMSFERALNFTGDVGEVRPVREKNAIAATAWDDGQQEISAGEGANQDWGDVTGNDGAADTNGGGWGGGQTSNGVTSVQDTSWGGAEGGALPLNDGNWGGGTINDDVNTAENTSWDGAPSQSNGDNNHVNSNRGKQPLEDGLFVTQDTTWGGGPLDITSSLGPSPTDSIFGMRSEAGDMNEQVQNICDAHKKNKAPAPLLLQPQKTRLAALDWHPDTPALDVPNSITRALGGGSVTDSTLNSRPHTEIANIEPDDVEAASGTDETEQILWGGWA